MATAKDICQEWVEELKHAFETSDAKLVILDKTPNSTTVTITSQTLTGLVFEFTVSWAGPALVALVKTVGGKYHGPPTRWKNFDAKTAAKVRADYDQILGLRQRVIQRQVEHETSTKLVNVVLQQEFGDLPEVHGVRIGGWIDDAGNMHRTLHLPDHLYDLSAQQIKLIVRALHAALNA